MTTYNIILTMKRFEDGKLVKTVAMSVPGRTFYKAGVKYVFLKEMHDEVKKHLDAPFTKKKS